MVKRVVILMIALAALFAVAAPAQAQEGDDGAYPPPPNGIAVSDTTVVPGQVILAEAFTFATGSEVGFTFFSHARALGSATADAIGVATAELRIPADATEGAHALVASGIAPDGSPLDLAAVVTVISPADADDDGGVSGGVSRGVSGGVTTRGAGVTGGLPRTGSEAVPLARIAAALVAVGGGLVFVTRRRRAAAAA